MVVSVVVGLRYTSISNWWDFLMMSRSRKLIWLLDSSVGLSCRLLCMALVCCTIISGSVWVAS